MSRKDAAGPPGLAPGRYRWRERPYGKQLCHRGAGARAVHHEDGARMMAADLGFRSRTGDDAVEALTAFAAAHPAGGRRRARSRRTARSRPSQGSAPSGAPRAPLAPAEA